MLIYFIIISTILLMAFKRIKRKKKYPPNFPPGPKSYIPIFGGALRLIHKPEYYFRELSKKYGPLFSYDFGTFRGVVAQDYRVIREALGRPEFNNRQANEGFRVMSGSPHVQLGLLASNGDIWNDSRRFTIKNLRDFGYRNKKMEPMIYAEIEEIAEKFRKICGQKLIIDKQFNGGIVNALWTIVAGQRFDQDDPEILGHFEKINKGAKMMIIGFFFPWVFKIPKWFSLPLVGNPIAQHNKNFEELLKWTEKYVKEHKMGYDENHHRDFIDGFLGEINKKQNDNQKNSCLHGELGEQNLFTILGDIFLTGSDTSTTVISWCFHLLALHQKSQDKMYHEINANYPGPDKPSLKDKDRFVYTQAVIHEVLRFASIVRLSFHEVSEDTYLEGYFLPKGTSFFFNLFEAHFDPKFWGDPENFRPERFIADDGSLVVRHDAFLAFSHGRRNCLGEGLARDQLFIFVTRLFGEFRVEPHPSKAPPKEIGSIPGTSYSPVPFPLMLTLRKN